MPRVNHIVKVMLVHNSYREPGGEDSAWNSESSLLERFGCDVHTLLFDNDDIPDNRSAMQSARLAVSTIWSATGARRVRDEAKSFRPDVVHFHNTFPLVSPAAYYSVKSLGLPVVQTLHNYRLMCPNVFFFRDGHPCEDCLGKFYALPAVVHACYRDSRPQTALTAAMVSAHRAVRTWSRQVDTFIALTAFSREKFIAGGLPSDRVVVKPNVIEPDPGPRSGNASGFAFAGRLVDYKGITTLLAAWRTRPMPEALEIAGTGPLLAEVKEVAAADGSIHLHGHIPHLRLIEMVKRSRALIVPSLLYENFPMTIVEAFACGVPVIASRLGAMADIVEDGKTGMLFNPGDVSDLRSKLDWAVEHPDQLKEMGLAARQVFDSNYAAAQNYQRLQQIYETAIERNRSRGRGKVKHVP